MKRTELDLNLESLRANAIGKLLDAVRAALGHCDDIEAMARVLHSQAVIKVQSQTGSHINGNGRHSPRQLLPRPRHYRRTSRADLLSAALLLIESAGTAGTDSIALESELRRSGVVPPAITIPSARAAINAALKVAVRDGRVGLQVIRGREGRCCYFMRSASTPAPAPTPSRPARLDRWLTSILIAQTAPLSVAALCQAAIETGGFDAKWGKGDTLSNQIAARMRKACRAGRVKRYGSGKFTAGGEPYTYSIVRPKVSVSKHGTELGQTIDG